MPQAVVWIAGGVLGLLVLGFALVGALFWFRRTPLKRVRDLDGGGDVPPVDDEDFIRAAERHLHTDLVDGHRVEVLFDGDETYPRLLEDLSGAERLITWHVFWYRKGKLANRLKDVLTERARAGVEVLFLHDWFGTDVEQAYLSELRDAGVTTATFRKPSLRRIYDLNERSHVRAVIIDGEVAWTGGFAIADEWLGDGRSPGCFRDTSVRFEGPAVHQLQAAFADEWVEATGDLLVGPAVFPGRGDGPGLNGDGGGANGTVAGLLHSAPSLGATEAERFFALSLLAARETCWVTSGYFVPNADFRRLLCQKVDEGVDMRILHPGGNTDRPATWYAARRHYEELLERGVRIWEYEPTMIHAKTIVVDRRWCAVGTTNFDNRSMALNDEVSLLIRDESLARRLHDRFLDDIGRAEEVTLETHRSRGPASRVKETLADLVSPLL